MANQPVGYLITLAPVLAFELFPKSRTYTAAHRKFARAARKSPCKITYRPMYNKKNLLAQIFEIARKFEKKNRMRAHMR